MKALILNSGLGHRMGVLTSEHPKCMTELSAGQTILSRQLRLLADAGVQEVVMTTGYFDKVLVDYCQSLAAPAHHVYQQSPLCGNQLYLLHLLCPGGLAGRRPPADARRPCV